MNENIKNLVLSMIMSACMVIAYAAVKVTLGMGTIEPQAALLMFLTAVVVSMCFSWMLIRHATFKREDTNKVTLSDSVRHVIRAMREDISYVWSWHCNIAMSAVDEGVDHETANRAAARFLQTLTQNVPEGVKGINTADSPYFIAFEEQWAELRKPVPHDQAAPGWYHLFNPDEPHTSIVYVSEEEGQLYINFNVIDGAAKMPMWDLKADSELHPVRDNRFPY